MATMARATRVVKRTRTVSCARMGILMATSVYRTPQSRLLWWCNRQFDDMPKRVAVDICLCRGVIARLHSGAGIPRGGFDLRLIHAVVMVVLRAHSSRMLQQKGKRGAAANRGMVVNESRAHNGANRA